MAIWSTTTISYDIHVTDKSNNKYKLSTTDYEKDLEIRLSSTLHPRVHCRKAYAKAMLKTPGTIK